MSDQEYIEALNNTKGIVVKRIKELEAESAKMRELMHKAVAEAAAVHLLTDYEALEDSIDAMASYLLRELAMEASDE